MKKSFKVLIAAIAALTLAVAFVFAGCGAPYVTSIEKTSQEGQADTYTVYYSNGTSSEIKVTNGKDGANGQAGADGKGVTAADLYEEYKKQTGEDITYAEFLKQYLTVTDDASSSVAQCLNSTMKLYTEFVESSTYSYGWNQTRKVSKTAIYTGSAVIWEIDKDAAGYTYIVTNYHVIYDSKADEELNGGMTARQVYCYLYGSEDAPVEKQIGVDGYGSPIYEKDENGCIVYDYGDYGVSCEIVGGSVEKDLAVLRAKTSELKDINPDIRAVELANDYYVGETAIAIGNPENEGISVTRGIVSVDNEYITLSIDGTKRAYRSIRMDTALYGGNSGGGLFNADGKLIGICNAGDSEDQNINYAIPLDIVTGTVENVLYYFNAEGYEKGVHIITMGITVLAEDSRYVYDAALGYGKIKENVILNAVNTNSIAEELGLAVGDHVKSLLINGKEWQISRTFAISDLILTMRPGDGISVKYARGGVDKTTKTYVVQSRDLKLI